MQQIPIQTITTHGGDILCFASVSAQATSGSGAMQVGLDGMITTFRVATLTANLGLERGATSWIFKNVAAGEHTLQVIATVDSSGSSITIPSLHQYSLMAIELPQMY